MRIVGGRFRGRTLAGPGRRDAIRPTADRTRESLFNILAARDLPEGAAVLDLFAGTGALGLEALSRGAAHVSFVEMARPALALLKSNIDALGVGGETTVLGRDATRPGTAPAPVDLIFLDPPYGRGLGPRAIAALGPGGWLHPGTLVVWEEGALEPAPPGFALADTRRYGAATLHFLKPAGAEIRP